ncbi:sentrin-specific protease 6-like [Uloborus diversus]|uniref:sentrin-specific protease 6-like n=1 Tax=Uloborus diversus TaxID=327109 RepID=UPI0024095924|nr:sentrin-specific protease 6-like [Uloborus diversus]
MSTENKATTNATRVMQNLSSASDCKVQTISARLLPSQSRNVQNVNVLVVEKSNPQKATPHRGASMTPRTPICESKTQMAQSRVSQNHPARFEGNSTNQGNRSSSNVNILPEKNTPRIASTVESKGPAARMSKELLEAKSQANTSGRIVTSIPETVTTNSQSRVNKNISNNFIENRTNNIQRNIVMISPDGSINKITPLRQIDFKGQKALNTSTPSVSVQENKSQGVEGITKSFTPKYVIADKMHEIGVKREAIKRPVTSTPVAKKKCVTRSPAGRKTGINLNLVEEIPADEQQHFINNLKNRPAGLSITPINSKSCPTVNPNSSASCVNTSSKVDTGHSDPIIEEPPDEDSNPMYCSKCKIFVACSSQWCPTCNNKLSLPSPTEYKIQPMEPNYVVTQNVTNVTVSKRIIINRHELLQPGNRSFHIQKQVLIETGSVVQTSPRSKGRPKKRPREPVCLTLSSDEEEPTQEFNSYQEESASNMKIFPMESEGSKSDQSGPELQEDEENEESDDEFPGVTDIHPKMHPEEEEEFDEEPDEEEMMAMEEDCEEEEEEALSGHEEGEEEEEEEEVPPEDEEEEMIQENENSNGPQQVMKCRSIRIGSYKVHPSRTNHIHVFLDPNSILFHAPPVREIACVGLRNIVLKSSDITRILVHFGRCLPIVFVYTTAAFGEALRRTLGMVEGETPYFDPTSSDDRQEKITLLIDQITEDHRRFLREVFPGDQKVKEIDQKTANEILVKSTPQQPQLQSVPLKPEPIAECQTRSMAALQQQQMTIKAVPPKPVTKILTYPPPPQTGGIPITSEDLACLNEGEFLNDAIIDFYLKYVFYEKLSECFREKTHIFSSYFYPRLTSKTDKQKGEDKTVQVRRHSQVKTWTRHIDIFSKDFIIIPINQNVHWFLAIICYPGRVPDAPTPSVNEEANKSSDNVTSTNDQDEGNKSINKDQNISADGIGTNNDENSMHSSNNSLYEAEESPDSEEPLPEAPDSSTHPDVVQQNQRRKETPCICIFDSLSGPNRWKIAATLREYLEMEWRMKKGTKKFFDRNTMQGCVIKCPQQTNYSDCGVYLLQYVESFFENPIPYFGNPMPDLSNWFPENKIVKKRQEIKDLILTLQKKQSPSSAS